MLRHLLLLLVLTASCKAAGTFVCERDEHCGAGRCEVNGYCSFSDPACSSGFRYDSYARDGVADTCVAQSIDAGVDVKEMIDADPCIAPFTRTEHGCHAFGAVTPTMTWAAARTACQGLGGDLPIINTAAESMYVATATGVDINARVWIGLSGTVVDGTLWTWIDGQTVAQKGLNNWYAAGIEPNAGDVVAAVRPDAFWAGRLDTEVFIVVCER